MKYQELTLIPTPEIPLYTIWEHLYTQLHIGLADTYNQHNINTIGVSFPRYELSQRTLGNKLRLIAPDETTLNTLHIEKWLTRLTDYIHIKSPAEVPTNTQPIIVKRYRHRPITQQAKAHAERYNLEYKAALEHCLKHRQPPKHLPYINMHSESTQHPYPLVIQQTKAPQANHGRYNTYGLSHQSSTVPHW